MTGRDRNDALVRRSRPRQAVVTHLNPRVRRFLDPGRAAVSAADAPMSLTTERLCTVPADRCRIERKLGCGGTAWAAVRRSGGPAGRGADG
jgi:hypothetical protein